MLTRVCSISSLVVTILELASKPRWAVIRLAISRGEIHVGDFQIAGLDLAQCRWSRGRRGGRTGPALACWNKDCRSG